MRKSACLLLIMLLTSCEHRGFDVTEYSGDYRVYAGIAEFFDCKTGVKYYVSNSGIQNKLNDEYAKLGLVEKEDAYIVVRGYLKEEQQMEGIQPATLFVAVKYIRFEMNRGCTRGIRTGQ